MGSRPRPMHSPQPVGFIGIGTMGAHVARNPLRAEFSADEAFRRRVAKLHAMDAEG